MTQKKMKPYLIGFGFSIILTLLAFYLVLVHISSGHLIYSHSFLIEAILGLALVQFLVQLYCFMGTELKLRWNRLMLFSTIGLVLIVVVGSIWIMNHLNNNMTMQQMEQYTFSQDGF